MGWLKTADDGQPLEDPRVTELKRMLLMVGGDGFQVPGWIDAELDKELDRLLSSGELMDGSGAIMMPGIVSGCHENSARLAKEQGMTCWTGLALSLDGCWRVHSWAVNKDGAVVETTVERVLYFGIPLSGAEVDDLLPWG